MKKHKKVNSKGARKATRTVSPAAARAQRGTRGKRAAESPAGAPTAVSPDSFSLQAECLIADAAELKGALAQLLENTETVTLDISALRRIDTAGLQVIATFVRERASNGHAVKWAGAAPALASAAQLLGLSALLRLPTDAGQTAGKSS
jgi:ABC-type transporter Mla MlaB component